MRYFFNWVGLAALWMFASQPAAATGTPSLSGTTIPSATQIVDMKLNVWTLSGGVAYENGKPTPSSGVILLLCYGGVVYQENSHHNWWLWDTYSYAHSWAPSIDPRVISPAGTTIPVATQIIDSELDVWTVSGGKAYEHGELTPSSGVILLLYAKGLVYQENSHHNWWYWHHGTWVATAAPLAPSASGTDIPTATEIIDNGRNVWTLSGGKAYENHEVTPSSDVILLLFYGGEVYQENAHHDWFEWNGKAWASTASDPRVGQPLAYVASSTTGGKNSVTVIDTGTNHVKATIPIDFEAAYMVVTPDAKYVYVVARTSNNTYGSVAVIDTAQESVITTVQVGYGAPGTYTPHGIAVSRDGTSVDVVYSSYDEQGQPTSSISTIYTAANTIVYALNSNDYPVSIAIDADGVTLYLASGNFCNCNGEISGAFIDAFETDDDSFIYYDIPTPMNAVHEVIYNALLSPNNEYLYSNYSYNNEVAKIAILYAAGGAVVQTIPAVLTVQVFSPDSQHLYGVGLGGVGVINTANYVSTTAVANIPGASDLAITPDGKHLYITDVSTHSVMVADTSTYTISTVVPVSVAESGAIAIVSAP